VTFAEQQQAFLRAIKRKPADHATRLVYGDWLMERGMDREGQEQHWLGRTGLAPYDPALRRQYAVWLLEGGQVKEAKLQSWMADVLTGAYKAEIVFTREGVLERASAAWAATRKSTRGYWERQAASFFREARGLLFLVSDPEPPSRVGLRREIPRGPYSTLEGESPLLYKRRGGGGYFRVFPR
jgi:uncharacterized protein (TIGR02996 family)